MDYVHPGTVVELRVLETFGRVKLAVRSARILDSKNMQPYSSLRGLALAGVAQGFALLGVNMLDELAVGVRRVSPTNRGFHSRHCWA
jgi:hypothetical protein